MVGLKDLEKITKGKIQRILILFSDKQNIFSLISFVTFVVKILSLLNNEKTTDTLEFWECVPRNFRDDALGKKFSDSYFRIDNQSVSDCFFRAESNRYCLNYHCDVFRFGNRNSEHGD